MSLSVCVPPFIPVPGEDQYSSYSAGCLGTLKPATVFLGEAGLTTKFQGAPDDELRCPVSLSLPEPDWGWATTPGSDHGYRLATRLVLLVRGDALVRDDSQITDADIASSNLVLWGDPGSNRILARIAGKLPVKWTGESLVVGKQQFPASSHGLVLVYPNPLNPNRYVVLNSGFTFREFDYLNNARQVPKLPDWAVVDTTTPPNERYPGKVVAAGFFGESWEFNEPRP